MTVAVFGAAGFIGRNLVHRLIEDNVDFTASDLIENPFSSNVSYARANVLDPHTIGEIVEKADVIVYLTASSLQASLIWPWMNMKVNIEGTMNVLEACRRFDIDKIVFSSASSVIGEPRYNPVDEEHPCHPRTPYTVSKLACEHYLKVYSELYSLDYLAFRLFNVYGPSQGVGVIPAVYKALSSGEAFSIYGDGSSIRDYIYISDVVDFLIRAVESNVKNEVINLGTGRATSILELVNTASKILKAKPKIEYKPQRIGEIGSFYADTSKLKKLFGDKPRTTLEEGLKRTFKSLK